MKRMPVACQTYTWQMLGEKWTGSFTELIGTVSRAGYDGIETTTRLLNGQLEEPQTVADALARHGLELAAVGLSTDSGFTQPERRDEDLEQARDLLRFLAFFPGCRLQMGSAQCPAATARAEARRYAVVLYAEIGRMARDERLIQRVVVIVCPESHYVLHGPPGMPPPDGEANIHTSEDRFTWSIIIWPGSGYHFPRPLLHRLSPWRIG